MPQAHEILQALLGRLGDRAPLPRGAPLQNGSTHPETCRSFHVMSASGVHGLNSSNTSIAVNFIDGQVVTSSFA
jgi:hypothetical protein